MRHLAPGCVEREHTRRGVVCLRVVLQRAAFGCVSALVACGAVLAQTPTKLAFGTQPSNATGGAAISPAVTVRILDAAGNLTNSTAWVTLSLGANPGGGLLSGTRTVSAVAGVATFANLSIDKIGTGYTLTAGAWTQLGLTGATSNAFNITLGAAAKLAFGVQPMSAASGVAIAPAVTARILDAGGNLTASTASITVAIGTNPGSGTLSGTKTKAAVAGVATYTDLSINLAGNGYTLTAVGTGLTGATSTPFNIGGATAIRVEDMADGSGGVLMAQSVAPGASLTAYAVSRNASGAFVANENVDVWSLVGMTGGVAAGDLVPVPTMPEWPVSAYLLTSGPDGNLWFTEGGAANKLGKITTAGVVTEYTVPTASSNPYDIATGPDGNLWFTEYNGNKIGRITTAGVITEFIIPTAGVNPAGITTGPDGNLWFTEESGNAIGRLTPAGQFFEFPVPTTDSFPENIASGPDGNLWFTEAGANKVGRITPLGALVEFPTSGTTFGVVAAPDGNIWFTEPNSDIGRITTGGVLTEFPIAGAYEIVAGADGNLWVSQQDSGSIGRITPAGTYAQFETPTPNGVPVGIALGPDGKIWFTEVLGHEIGRFDSKSTTFTAHASGAGAIHAAKTSLASTDSGTLTVGAGTPTKLAFGTQPSNTGVGAVITPAVTIRILDSAGNLTTSTASVTIAIGTNPGGGVLSGTKTVNAVAGVATFSTLSINQTGTGYTLTATSTGLTGATSNAFNILSGPPNKLAFGTQPSSSPINATIAPPVTVRILDAAGNLTTSTASVTVAIGTNPAGGVLSGTKTVNAVTGIATFSTLSIDKPGVGYTLTATSTGLTGATSTPFDIGAATKIRVETKADGTGVVVPAQNIAAGASLDVYAIGRDANNNFVANLTPDSWSLTSVTGSVTATDLVSAGGVTDFASGSLGVIGITAGPDGNLWFTDGGNNVGRMTPSGATTRFTVPGSSLNAIAPGPDGNLWLSEEGGRIVRITPAGAFTEFLIPTPSVAYGIVAGPDGNLWFTEQSATTSKIGRITPAGVFTEFWLPSCSCQPQPYGIAVGPDGALWFAENGSGKIGRITTAGSVTEFTIPTASSQPRFIASGPDGNLWLTEYAGNKIGKITTAGVITEYTIPTASSHPSGIVAGADGALWFTESSSNKIGRITTAGAISEFGLPAGSTFPGVIASGPDQNVWFTEGSGRIGRVGTTAAIANGKATFTGHKAGSAIIHAVKAGMTSTDSGVLTVPAGTASRLVFGVQPNGAVAGAAFLPALTVQIQDANGNVLNSTASVTVAIGTNPGGGTLAGTKTNAAVAGVATFSNLSINKVGRGYTLTATSIGLTSATSATFTIRPGAATKIIVETAPDGSGTTLGAQSVAIGSTVTAWAISRDANNNYVNAVVPDSWSLTGKTGGVVDGDLVPAAGFTEFTLRIPAWALTNGLDGNVWFSEADTSTQWVANITPSGSITEWNVMACNVTSCPTPNGIVNPSDGKIWYTDGHAISSWLGEHYLGNLNTYGLIAGPDGNLWFGQYQNDVWQGDKIGRLTLAGVWTDFPVPTAKSAPTSITSGPDNNIWFAESLRDQIGRITPSGTITEFPINGGSEPTDITPAPDGNVWFTERSSSKIGRISTAGIATDFTLGWGASGVGTPTGIVAGSDGSLWFTEQMGAKIGRMSLTGSFSELPVPNSSAFLTEILSGSDGNLYFLELIGPTTNKMARLNPGIGSATLTGHQAGTAVLHAAKAGLTSTDSGTVTVAAAAATLTLNPSTVSGASPSTGTVTLSLPAPAGGRLVNLSSSNTILATVPNSVTVPANQTTKNFTITTKRVYATSFVTIKAVIQSVAYTTKLTLKLAPTLGGFSIPSMTVSGNSGSATGTVSLSGAVSNSVTVTLTSSSAAVVIPATVTIPANASSAPFAISVPDLTGFTNAILTATLDATSKQAMLTVLVPHITAPVADPGSYTYPASTPVGFNGWAQTINNQALDYRWVPYDPANAGGFVTVVPGPTRFTTVPSTPQMRLVVTVSGTPQPAVMNSADACSGVMPGSCAWRAISLVPNRTCPAPSPILLQPTVSGLTNWVSGSPPSISSSLFQASDRYSWLLEVESPTGSGLYSPAAVTQAAGTLNDGFDPSNRVWTPKLAGNVQLGPGHYRLQSLVARPNGSCYSTIGWSPIYSFTVTAAGANLLGLAPGIALPGEPSLVLYGTGFDATTSVSLSGPVYALTDSTFTSPLCNLSTGTCAQTVLPASFGSSGTLSFALPSISTGYYFVRSRSNAGTLSVNGDWLRVDLSAKTNPVVPPAQHNVAPRMVPGQTITGTFAAGGDTTGTFVDYNTYYFFGTAGSVINASLTRVDTSKTWEDPASLDPQLEVIAPDGLIYDNLRKVDNQPGVDYNASLSGAVLPQTGIYFLRPETLKGSGDYRLTFSFTSVAAAPAASRAIPLAGNYSTTQLNRTVTPVAVVLDPRGYTVSGADVSWGVVAGPDDTGTVQFQTPTATLSASDGSSYVTAKLTALGKVQVAPALTNPILAQWIVVQPEAQRLAVARFAPVGVLPIQPLALDQYDNVWFLQGKREDLPVWSTKTTPETSGSGPALTGGGAAAPANEIGGRSSEAAATAAPEPIAVSAAAVRGPSAVETITSCATSLFVEAGTNLPSQPPFTITLTDLTPSTGGTIPNGIVDSTGIHGHRIEKTIRLHLDITDATGLPPNYPVLVHLALAGPAKGTLILDPDGNRVQCTQASFLWHERNAQNQIIALNEEFEYTLGRYAPLAGFVPHLGNPSQLDPVWGTGEALAITLSTVDSNGATRQLSQTVKVKPESGKPHHFSVSVPPPPQGTPEVVWTYWSDQWLDPPNFNSRVAANYSAYYLLDQYDNLKFGYTNTVPAPTSSLPSVSFQFFDETAGSRDGVTVDPVSYGYKASWQMSTPPQGNATTTFSVTYPTDPDWAGGVVSKAVTFTFVRGTLQFIEGVAGWDCFWLPTGAPCISDPPTPWSVSPGASGDAILKSMTGTTPVDPGRQVFIIGKSSSPPVYLPPLTPPWVEVADNPAFKLSLVDSKGQVVPDAIFKAYLCPRYDHFIPGGQNGTPRPCTTTPVQSTSGVIASVRINANGVGAADSQGYLGIELVQAPSNPGDYYIQFEILEGKPYKVRSFMGRSWDLSTAGESKGAFKLVTVVSSELLNEGLAPVTHPLNMALDRVVYVRDIDPTETASSYQADFILKDQDTSVETTLQNITLRRLGSTSTFFSDPISIVTPDPPLQPLGIDVVSEPKVLERLGLRSLAGTITPGSGRYEIHRKRNKSGTIFDVRIQFALTRLAKIVDATANFDGISQNPPGTGTGARDHIEAQVQLGADGYVGARLFNVDDPSIFSFESWQGTNLTTDLRPSGLVMGTAQLGTRGVSVVVGPSGALPFQALVAVGETVNPGLYRIVARWGKTANFASWNLGRLDCDTDRPDVPVCENEWIVSVGQRVFLDVESAATGALPSYLAAVGDSRTSDVFLDAVAQSVTANFTNSGANVVVTRDNSMLRPYLRHLVRATLGQPNPTDMCSPPNYGGTRLDASFPLTDPNLDLINSGTDGISLEAVYQGWSKGGSGASQQWIPHTPPRASNQPPNACGAANNPCASSIFQNRLVNVATHEIAHGVGLLTPAAWYPAHSTQTTYRLNAVKAMLFPIGCSYTEDPAPGSGVTDLHEPILAPPPPGNSGFGEASPQSNKWVMTWAIFRWKDTRIDISSSYDPAVPPQFWLVFDRPLQFSLTSDYSGEDRSDQRYFGERLPVCLPVTRKCR